MLKCQKSPKKSSLMRLSPLPFTKVHICIPWPRFETQLQQKWCFTIVFLKTKTAGPKLKYHKTKRTKNVILAKRSSSTSKPTRLRPKRTTLTKTETPTSGVVYSNWNTDQHRFGLRKRSVKSDLQNETKTRTNQKLKNFRSLTQTYRLGPKWRFHKIYCFKMISKNQKENP